MNATLFYSFGLSKRLSPCHHCCVVPQKLIAQSCQVEQVLIWNCLKWHPCNISYLEYLRFVLLPKYSEGISVSHIPWSSKNCLSTLSCITFVVSLIWKTVTFSSLEKLLPSGSHWTQNLYPFIKKAVTASKNWSTFFWLTSPVWSSCLMVFL